MSCWLPVLILFLALCNWVSTKSWFSDNYEMLDNDSIMLSFDYLVPYHYLFIQNSCSVFTVSEPRLVGLLNNVTSIRNYPGFVLRGRDLKQLNIKAGFLFITCKFGSQAGVSFENNFGVFFRLKDFYDIHLQRMNWDMQTYNISDGELLPLQKFDPFPELETNLPDLKLESPNNNLLMTLEPQILEEWRLKFKANGLETPIGLHMLNKSHAVQVLRCLNSFSEEGFYRFRVLQLIRPVSDSGIQTNTSTVEMGKFVDGWILSAKESIILVSVLERSQVSSTGKFLVVITTSNGIESSTIHIFPMSSLIGKSNLVISSALSWCGLIEKGSLAEGVSTSARYMCSTEDGKSLLGFQISTNTGRAF